MSRYSAFISYSHADTPVVRWLHHALETFRVPKALVGTGTPLGPAPRRLAPIFRDRDELPASGDLGTELRAALADAAFLIVICSPRSAKSHWVNEEILAFKRLHGDGRVLALIASGEPYSADAECFPPALRFRMGPGGVLTTEPAEPIAADIRPGKDGRRLASLKLLAGLTGLKLDSLVQREAARRQRRLAYIASGATAVAAITLLLAIYALHQRDVARQQTELAEASLDFLVNTFSIANPATENPRTITAVTILNRVSARVEHDMARTPQISAKLLTATGGIWLNLGLPKEAERDLRAALRLTPPMGEARSTVLLKLAAVSVKRGDVGNAEPLVRGAEASVERGAPYAPLIRARVAELRGTVAFYKAKYADAAALSASSAKMYSELPSAMPLELGRTLMNEGVALTKLRRFADAAGVLARAEAITRSAFGPDDVRTATAVHNRANEAFEAGDLKGARALVARAMDIYRHVLDGDHPLILDAELLQGRVAHSQHDLPGAVKAFGHAAAMATKLFGIESIWSADAHYYLARAQADGGLYDQAFASLAITKRAYDKQYDPLDPDQVELLDTRAQLLRAAGRTTESSSDCHAALKLRVRLDAHDPALPAATRRCAALAQQPPAISLRFQ